MSNSSPSEDELEEEETFSCNICNITCASALNLQSHFLGAKHKKAEEALRNHKDDKADVRQPNGTLEDQINACKGSEPAVGLEYIYDYGYQYECRLCDTTLALTSMFLHIVGGKHRLKYLNRHHPPMINNTVLHPACAKGSKKLQKLKDMCMIVEKEFGRKRINVVTVGQMESELPKAAAFPEDPAARSTKSLMRRAGKEYGKWGYRGDNRYGPDSNMDFTSDDFTELEKPKDKTLPVTFKELKAVNVAYMKNRKNRPPPAQPKVEEKVVIEIEPNKEEPKKDEKENDDKNKNKDESDDSDGCSIDFSGDVDEFFTNQDLFDFLEKFKVFGIEDVQFILKVREKMQTALTVHRYWPGRPRMKKPESVTKANEHAAKQKQLQDKVKKVKVQKQQNPALPPEVSSYSPYPTYYFDEKYAELTTESNQEQHISATYLQDSNVVTEPSSLEPEPTTEKNQDESLSENHLQKNKPSCTEQEYKPTNKKLSFKISAPPVEVNPLVASGLLSNMQQEFTAKSNSSKMQYLSQLNDNNKAQDTKSSSKSTPDSPKELVAKSNPRKMQYLSEFKENKKVHDTKPPLTSASSTPQEFVAKSSPGKMRYSSKVQDAKPASQSVSDFPQEFSAKRNPIKIHHPSQLNDDHKVLNIKPSSESASNSPQEFADQNSPSKKQHLSQLNKELDTKPSSKPASVGSQEIPAKSSSRKMQYLSQLNDDINKVQDTKPSSNPASDSPQEPAAERDGTSLPVQELDSQTSVSEPEPCSNLEPVNNSDKEDLNSPQKDNKESAPEPGPLVSPDIQDPSFSTPQQSDSTSTTKPRRNKSRWNQQETADQKTPAAVEEFLKRFEKFKALKPQQASNKPAGSSSSKPLDSNECSKNPPGSAPPKGVNPPGSAPPKGVNLPGSAPPSGVNPPGSAPSSGVNPPGFAYPKELNPPASAPPRGVNYPASAPPRGQNPPGSAPPRGINPPASAPPRGQNPPGSAPPRGINPPASASHRGLSPPGSAPPGAVKPYERFNQPSEYTPSRAVNQEQIRGSAPFVSPNGQNVYENLRNVNSPDPPKAPNSHELLGHAPGPAPPRAPNSHEQFRNALGPAPPRAPYPHELLGNAPGPSPPRAPNSHKQFRNAPGPAPPRAPNSHEQFRNAPGPAAPPRAPGPSPPRAPNSHEQFRNALGSAPPRAPNPHEQFRNAPGPALPRAPNPHEQFGNAPGPSPPRAPNPHEQFGNVPGPACFRPPNSYGWPGSSAALTPPRAQFPQESNAPRTIPPFLTHAQNDITSKFFDSIKNMEVSEVVETLTKITATNPSFKGIHVPSLVQYLIDTGKLKPPSNAQNR
ncbi:bromodomain-containing protein 4-like [Hyperolius riggenbachi]|uniref:bromodomain-containing protein 4-like n=1 Tax=Hyperolius riggenbachi TaxID=752182 RepID=UPI0035A313A4